MPLFVKTDAKETTSRGSATGVDDTLLLLPIQQKRRNLLRNFIGSAAYFAFAIAVIASILLILQYTQVGRQVKTAPIDSQEGYTAGREETVVQFIDKLQENLNKAIKKSF